MTNKPFRKAKIFITLSLIAINTYSQNESESICSENKVYIYSNHSIITNTPSKHAIGIDTLQHGDTIHIIK